MPFLDAKALETDPDGMAFLRAVLKPDGKRKSALSGSAAGPEASPSRASPRTAKHPRRALSPKASAPAPAA